LDRRGDNERRERHAAYEQFRLESRAGIDWCTRISSWIVVAGFLVLAVEDFLVYRHMLLALWAEKALSISFYAALGLLAGTPWGVRHAVGLAIAFAIWFQAASFYHAFWVGEGWAVSWNAMVISFGCVLLLPWRPRHQAAAVGGAWAAVFAGAFAIDGTLRPQHLAALVTSGSTVFLAVSLDRRRFAFWHAEKALRESEDRFRGLAEHSQDVIGIWSPDRTILYVSPAFEKFTGRPARLLYEDPFRVLDVVHPDDRSTFMQAMARVAQGEFCRMDVRVVHFDGNEYALEGWGMPIRDAAGKVIRYVGSWHDLTERVRLIRDLEAYSRVVAHDLKNPIMVIGGYVQLLEMNLEGRLTAEDRELIEKSVKGCERMTRIVNELLLLAQVRTQNAVAVAPLDMGAIVAEVRDRLSVMIADSRAELVEPGEWPRVLGYAAWIEEVWTNYVSNALKYGGSPPRVELGAEPGDDGTWRFWVRDDGPGIAAADQERLFHEFTRLQHSRRDSHGLGLSIVKRIVERLGGRVGVESTAGQGSKFWFTLPAAEPAALPARPAAGNGHRRSEPMDSALN